MAGVRRPPFLSPARALSLLQCNIKLQPKRKPETSWVVRTFNTGDQPCRLSLIPLLPPCPPPLSTNKPPRARGPRHRRGAHPDVPRRRHRSRNWPDSTRTASAGPAHDGALSRAAAEWPAFECSRTAAQMRSTEDKKREKAMPSSHSQTATRVASARSLPSRARSWCKMFALRAHRAW